ncbi:MAG TPA: response regulator [bacterium]
MNKNGRPLSLLVAEDDQDDRLMIREALDESQLPHQIDFVKNGAELMDYLYCHGTFAHRSGQPLPQLLLLDLNMPEKGGYEVLSEIKANPELRRIPTVMLTTSQAERDIVRAYDLGVSSFITKPVTFGALVDLMKALAKYWFEIVVLPGDKVD